MARADVAVIGGGLAGLSCGIALAERGASVFVAAKGMAATHWTHGGLDLAAPAGTRTAREGVARLATDRSHPLAHLATDLPAALDEQLARLADVGLRYAGGLDDSFAQVPTAIGTLRPASVLPAAQAALREPWRGVGLLLVGFRRYRDAWPGLAADNLRARRWPGGPQRIEAREVELPALDDLHNLNALTLARHFDDPAWRHAALRAIAEAIPAGRWRIGLPAVLGLADHAAAFAEATVALMPDPVVYWPARPEAALPVAARAAGVRVVVELYVDLDYAADGTVILQRQKVPAPAEKVAARVRRWLEDGQVEAADGTLLRIDAESICVHGDGPNVLEVVRTVRRTIEEAGQAVGPLATAPVAA